ncbi:MAG TPA: class I SAM-dependent methyltransferase [Kofleriaceae bacterium]|nr:class I SAM-dependent methyltransferase [Kofleriaceae bacterium]
MRAETGSMRDAPCEPIPWRERTVPRSIATPHLSWAAFGGTMQPPDRSRTERKRVVEIERERATLFDRGAERYDRSRPGYPDALIDEVLGPSPRGLAVLDVGAGTGLASRLLAHRRAHVLGVELDPRMAEIARRHGIATEVAAFEIWDPAGRTFDRVTCAQAWDWLDPEVRTEKAASVLRPGGRLCLFWSVGHHPHALAEALHAAYRRVLPADAPRLVIGYGANDASDASDAQRDVRAVADALGACRQLSAPRVASFAWTRTYSRGEWLDQLLSHTDHAALAPDLRYSLLGEIGEAIDRFGGRFDMTYATILISASRI